MNYVVTIILVLLAGWLLWVWLSPADLTPDVNTGNGTTTVQDDGAQNATSGQAQTEGPLGTLRTYQSPVLLQNATNSWSFIMQVPEGTDVEAISDSLVEFSYVGPDAEPNAELTDGYYMTLELVPTSTIAAYVDAADALTEVATQTVGSFTTRTYETENELGETVTHYVFPITTGTNATGSAFVDVAVTIAGNGQYEQSVLRSLQSLRFTQR